MGGMRQMATALLLALAMGCGSDNTETKSDPAAQCQAALEQQLASCDASKSRLDDKHYQGCKEQAQEAYTRCLENTQEDDAAG